MNYKKKLFRRLDKQLSDIVWSEMNNPTKPLESIQEEIIEHIENFILDKALMLKHSPNRLREIANEIKDTQPSRYKVIMNNIKISNENIKVLDTKGFLERRS